MYDKWSTCSGVPIKLHNKWRANTSNTPQKKTAKERTKNWTTAKEWEKIQNGKKETKKRRSNSVIILALNNFRIANGKKETNIFSGTQHERTHRDRSTLVSIPNWLEMVRRKNAKANFLILSVCVEKTRASVAYGRQYETNAAAVAHCCWSMFFG